MWQVLKVAFLYIGTSIGAGFSSGKEIALFFGNVSPSNVALSAVFTALLMALFLVAGKLNCMPKSFAVKLGVFISALISLTAMIAGSEFVMRFLTNTPLLGLILTVLGGVVVAFGIEKIKLLNTALVPLLIVTIAIVFSMVSVPQFSPKFSISKPILYSGLDALLGGIIISREGQKLSYKQIFATCAFTGIFIGTMLFMLQTVVLNDISHSSMPVLAVAEQLGMKWACGILITVAIFTTLVSALHIVFEQANEWLQNLALKTKSKHTFLQKFGANNRREIVIFLILLLDYPLSFIGFDNIVNFGYPFTSFCGIAMICFTASKLLFTLAKKIKSKSCAKKILPN
ncbi:MAG: hypothetical protein RSC44_00300 [Clostridia bacterium]